MPVVLHLCDGGCGCLWGGEGFADISLTGNFHPHSVQLLHHQPLVTELDIENTVNWLVGNPGTPLYLCLFPDIRSNFVQWDWVSQGLPFWERLVLISPPYHPHRVSVISTAWEPERDKAC